MNSLGRGAVRRLDRGGGLFDQRVVHYIDESSQIEGSIDRRRRKHEHHVRGVIRRRLSLIVGRAFGACPPDRRRDRHGSNRRRTCISGAQSRLWMHSSAVASDPFIRVVRTVIN